jgi:hypothetical protein
VRGDQVFGERFSVTTGITTSTDNDFPDDGFFPDINDLFGNLNMGNNIDAAAQAAPYMILSSLFQILLEFLVLAFGVDMISISCLDTVCSSILVVCMISLITGFIVMLYLLFIWIKSYGQLLIFSTIQKPDDRQVNSNGIAAATRLPLFEGMHYKRWRMRVVLWF